MPRTSSPTITSTDSDQLTSIAIVNTELGHISEALGQIVAAQARVEGRIDDLRRQLDTLPERYVMKDEFKQATETLAGVRDQLVRHPLNDLALQVENHSKTIASGQTTLKVLAAIWTVLIFLGPFIADWAYKLISGGGR